MSHAKSAASALMSVAAFLWVTAGAPAADVAAEAPPEAPPPPADEWTFSVAPYLWGAGLQGDVGVFGREPIDVDLSFGDIFKNLRFGGMAVFELSNGSVGIFGDIIYVKTEADESITRTISGVPATLAATVETSSFTGTVMGEYRAYATESASFDLMAGARIWNVDNDISVTLAAGGAPLAAFSGSDGATWVDPMIGAKARFDIDPSWYVTAWGMVGGFGAGSEVTWDVMGGVGYRWNEWLATVGGYRALGVDYDNDGFVYDVIQHGPFLGAVMRF